MKLIVLILTVIVSFFSVGYSSNYYWVGGSGNWNDINHWATTSGGTVLQTVVPSQNDDVFFDAGSGFTVGSRTVIVNITNASCRHINFTGALNNPIVSGGGGTLNCYGSFTLINGMTWNCQINFLSSSAETITTSGVILSGGQTMLTFNGSGSWTLQNDLLLAAGNGISFMQGIINSNNKNIVTGGFSDASGTGPRVLNLGSSIITNSGTGHSLQACWTFQGSNSTLNAGTSKLIFTGAYAMIRTKATDSYYDIQFNETGDMQGAGNYHSVTFSKQGFINNSCSIYSLSLLSGANCQLATTATPTITGVFNSSTVGCSNYNYVQSTTLGQQATFNVLATTTVIAVGNVIQDIKIIGGVFNANSSIDNGNNAGIVFTAPTSPTNLFWVGGSGSWDDISHWASSSGGAGGFCIPRTIDNVFFDGGSGFTGVSKTVTITAGSSCKNITCNGATTAPTFTATSDGVLNIYGSSVWQSGMQISEVEIWYRANSNETITSNGVSIIGNMVTFLGSGSWTLIDGYTHAASLIWPYYSQTRLFKGTLNTNGQICNFDKFNDRIYASGWIHPSLPHTLVLGSSVVNVTTVSGNSYVSDWSLAGSSATLSAGTSTINFTGTGVYMYPKNGHVYNNINFMQKGTINNGSATYNNVVFNQDADILTSQTYTNLTLGAGYTTILQANSTQSVLVTFNILTPYCGGWGNLQSSNTLIQAKIYTPATGTVNIRNFQISAINALGGAVFTASSSINSGNNTGITFLAPSINTLYWVGGSGNWNDINHWSFTSGGAGGACVPGPSDDVFFDSNTGFTTSNCSVTFSTSAFCKNITCAGSPTAGKFLIAGTPTLNVGGSLSLQTGMTYNVYTNFVSSSNESITTNNVIIGSTFQFNNGGYTLQDNYTSNNGGGISVTTGTLSANNKNIFLAGRLLNTSVLSANTSTVRCNPYVNTGTVSVVATDLTVYNGFSDNKATNYNAVTVFFSGGINLNANVPKFRKLDLRAGNTINGVGVFDTLIFASGQNYQLQSAQTQTVTSAFYPSGNPCAVTFIQSTTAGTRANLKVVSGNINYDFVNMKDIDATSSYTTLQMAGHSTNAGNNLNITFAPTTTAGIVGLGPDVTLCQKALPITLNTTQFYPNPVTTFSWTGGATSNSLSVNAGGTYSVLVKYGTSCTVGDNIVITANPTPTISSAALQICSGSSATVSVLGANSYTWANPSATTSSIIVSPSVTTSYSVVGTSTAGCVSDVTAITVSVNPTPTVAIGTVSSNSICFGGNSIITPSGATTYTLLNTGATGTSFTVSPTISTTYSISGTSNANCVSSNQATSLITVNTTPTVAIASVSSNTICSGNNSIITPNGATTYTLLNTGATGTSFTVNPTISTTYSISGTSNANCASGNQVISLITVNTTPTVAIGTVSSNTICSGNSSIITPSGANTYTLLNTGVTGTTFTVNPTSNTTYSLIGTSGSNCNSNNTAQTTIIVNVTPTIGITSVSPATICSGNSSIITPSGASANSYTLYPDNISGSSFTVSPNTTTTYTITGENSNGCISTLGTSAQSIITVNSTPTVSALFSSNALCSSQQVTITPSGANGSYTIEPGTYTTNTTAIITPTAGTTIYTITATNTNGCVSTLSNQIYTTSVSVVTNPTITVSAITSSICVGNTASITPFGASTYTLMPDNITINSGDTFTLTPTTASSYTINGTATGGCFSIPSTQFVTTISINPNPTITALSALSNTICSGLTTTLTASGANTYTWSGGPSTPNYVVTPSATTVYTVIGENSFGCNNSSTPTTLTVSVLTTPTLSALTSINTNTLCSGNSATITLSGASAGSTYTLLPNAITHTISFVVTPIATTDYTVIATDNLTGCLSTSSSQIFTTTVNVLATPSIALASIAPSNSICSGQSATLVVTGANTYTLVNDLSTIQPFIVTPSVTTTYSVIGTALNGCNSLPNTDLITTITVNQTPTISLVSISPSQTLCAGQSATLTVTGASTYTLHNTNATASPFVLTPTVTTTYTITGTSNNACISDNATSLTTTLTVGAGILVSTNVTSVSCFGGNNGQIVATVSPSASVVSYTWNTGSNLSQVSNLSAGNYTVTASDINNCMTTQTIAIIEPTAITIIETNNVASCDNAQTGEIAINITGGTSIYSVLWMNGQTGNSIANLPTGVVSGTITDNNGCVASYSTMVNEQKCLTTLIPQLITPNGDGKNDFFFINTINYFPDNKLEIYNRWGSLVYTKKQYDNTFNGKPNVSNSIGDGVLPAGTYFIIFDYGDNKTEIYKGYVEIKY